MLSFKPADFLLTILLLSSSLLHAKTLVPFDVFQSWKPESQAEYLSGVRFSWAEFENESRLQIPRLASNSIEPRFETLLTRILLPSADAEENKFCPIGGGERPLVRNAEGKMLCPTGGRSCGSYSDGGFKCFPLFANACVSRLPLLGLTERCQKAAEKKSAKLNREEYASMRTQVADLIQHCEARTYGARFKPNCDRFEDRIEKLAMIDKDDEAPKSTSKPSKVDPTPVKPAPQPIAFAPSTPQPKREQRACFRKSTVPISYNGGGETDEFLARAKKMNQQGVGVKINGPCISACVDMIANLPVEHVCIGPNAELGFHYVSDDNENVSASAKRYTEALAKTYPAPLRNFWDRVKGIGDPLSVKYMKGETLKAVYRSCKDVGDICKSDEEARATTKNITIAFEEEPPSHKKSQEEDERYDDEAPEADQ